MSYDTAKYYGNIVRDAAKRISSYDDIYKVAAALPYDMRAYFIQSRLAFSVLYTNIKYEKEIVAKVIKKFILSPEVDQYIITNPDLDKSKKFDFIERGSGDFFSLMETIKSDIIALDIISRPNDFEEDKVAWAVNLIADRIKSTPENQAAMKYSLETLFPSDKNSETQPITRSEKEKEQSKYTIANESLLLGILNYLRSTGVLDMDFPYHELASAVVNADISEIHPLLKDKFWSSLSHIKRCVKDQKKQWLRDACTSINIVPKQASKNNTNHKEWYEMLCDIVEKHLKK